MGYDVLPFPNADKQKELVAEAEAMFLAAETAKKPREDLYRLAYKAFRAYLKRSKDWKFSTLILDPVLWSALTTKSDRMKKAIFATYPVVSYKSEGEAGEQDDLAARAATQLFGHYQRKDRPRVKLGTFLDALSLSGNGFVMFHHEYREADVTREVEQEAFEDIPLEDEFGNPQMHPETKEPLTEPVSVGMVKVKVKTTEAIQDRPTWTSIHFTEAFPDASALGIHDGSYFIRRSFVRVSEAKRRAKLAPEQGGWSKKAVKRAEKRGCPVAIDEIKKQLQWAAESAGGEVAPKDEPDKDPFMEVWEVFRQQKLLCYTILNRGEVATYKRVINGLGRIPIEMVKCHPLDGEFWAMSTFELLQKVHQNYQDQRNAGATETLLSVFGLTTAMPGFQMHKLLHEPGAVIPVTNHEQIKFQTRPGTGIQMAQNQMSLERASMDEVTASSEAFRGLQPRESRTATTDSLANQGAGLRLQGFIDDFEEQFIIPWGEWWLCDMQEHTDPGAAQRILKDPETVAAFFGAQGLEVVSGAQSSELRAMEDKRILEAIEILGKTNDPFIERRVLIKAFMERMMPEKVDAVVMDDEAMLKREVAKLEMAGKLEIEKLRIQLQTQAQMQQLQAQLGVPPPDPMGGAPVPASPGPAPPGPDPMGGVVDPMGSEPMMDAGMREHAAEMGGLQ